MRVLSCILILLGFFLLAHAAYDEIRGTTHMPLRLIRPVQGSRLNGGYLYSIPVRRDVNPDRFRRFMILHWIYACVIESGGWTLYLIYKPEKSGNT